MYDTNMYIYICVCTNCSNYESSLNHSIAERGVAETQALSRCHPSGALGFLCAFYKLGAMHLCGLDLHWFGETCSGKWEGVRNPCHWHL